MKLLLISLIFILPLSAKADFVTGMVVGSMMSSGDETVVKLTDGGKPCLITLKKTGGTFELNANYIESIEETSLRGNCKDTSFLTRNCEKVSGSKITLANYQKYNTFSTLREIKDQISRCPLAVSAGK